MLLSFISFPSHAATSLDPALKWKTIETPHFSINYYPEIEAAARRFAPIAEDVYDVMTKVMKYKLDMKTQVTLQDTTDYGNGYTTVFPYPAITLYLADLSGDLNPYKYDDYLRYVFLHEYTHALHLDIAEGGASLLRAIFGRSLFPNALEPWFMIEGLATYMESRYTQAGRGRDPRWEMMMRMDVLDGNIKTIDQAAVGTIRWPLGNLRYVYGVEFLKYLSETYGEDKLITLAHVYGDYLFAYGADGAFTALYQKNLPLLWGDWLDHLREKYQKQKASLGQLTEPRLVTTGGYQNLQPKWSKTGRAIYYLQRNADDYPQIRRLDPSTGRSEKIFEGQVYDESFKVTPDNKLLFSKGDIYKNFYFYRDIYLFDLKTDSLDRLTNGMRASDPAVSPDGKQLVFVKNEKGMRDLSCGFRGHYFSPSFSPDGKKILAAKRLASGEQRLVLIDLASSLESSVTNLFRVSAESVSEADPCFSADGVYIFFDADYTGIVNLYAWHLPTKKLYQITNVIGGALMPDISPDGRRLAYVSYSSRGYDVAVMDIDVPKWKQLALTAGDQPKINFRLTDSQTYEVHDYNPWPTLIPRFWMPYNYYNENGVQNSIYIGGVDPLGQHYYYLNLGLDGKPSYNFAYVNNQFLPQIYVALSDLSVPYGWGSQTYWERERGKLLLFSLFDNRVFTEYDRAAISFGFRSINLTNISSIDALSPKPSLGNVNSFIVGGRYVNARQYPASISPEDGLDLALNVEKASNDLASDYSFTSLSFALKNYWRSFIKRQVTASALYGFYSRGDQLAQSNFSWRTISVRGYQSTAMQGNKGALLSLEYRFPIWYIESGALYGAQFFDRLWGDLFFDNGGATFGRLDQLSLKRGVGGELSLSTSSAWGFYDIIIKVGYAHGLDQGGSDYFYFNFAL